MISQEDPVRTPFPVTVYDGEDGDAHVVGLKGWRVNLLPNQRDPQATA